ncbi:DUF1007 family protein [Allorhizobium sp. BGMRC 0089]|uniref:DUF1007 family protein n=1 Tax=Allorhizobium sonneratiae TaxID=2934936 RepID=UPI0020344400|nr:DUF1007 family protein [Allorhizobium sonneratiae]MCM2291336.1 DUF1007 family protein [Allorhizobium sonneratiae]
MSRKMKSMARIALSMLALFAAVPPALAHPDIAITVRLLFNLRLGVLTGLGESWTFDKTYSRTLLDQFDRNRDEKLDEDEVKALGAKLAADLNRRQYFTEITLDGKRAAGLTMEGFSAVVDKGVVTASFAFSVAAPLDVSGRPIAVTLLDRDYVAAFRLADQAGIQLRGDPDNKCKTSTAPDPANAYFAGLVVPTKITLSCQP